MRPEIGRDGRPRPIDAALGMLEVRACTEQRRDARDDGEHDHDRHQHAQHAEDVHEAKSVVVVSLDQVAPGSGG